MSVMENLGQGLSGFKTVMDVFKGDSPMSSMFYSLIVDWQTQENNIYPNANFGQYYQGTKVGEDRPLEYLNEKLRHSRANIGFDEKAVNFVSNTLPSMVNLVYKPEDLFLQKEPKPAEMAQADAAKILKSRGIVQIHVTNNTDSSRSENPSIDQSNNGNSLIKQLPFLLIGFILILIVNVVIYYYSGVNKKPKTKIKNKSKIFV